MLIILPRNDRGAPAATEAQTKLASEIRDPVTVVMIVYGDDPSTPKILEVCAARASVKPAIRRVVWCPDPSVLSPAQKKAFYRSNAAAVAVGLMDTVAATLTAAKAGVRAYVESAFMAAEDQRPNL